MTCPDAENCRSMAQMRDRDPVDAAFAAVACLTTDQLRALADKFNRVFGDPPNARIMKIEGLE